jgi:hypothetical protein
LIDNARLSQRRREDFLLLHKFLMRRAKAMYVCQYMIEDSFSNRLWPVCQREEHPRLVFKQSINDPFERKKARSSRIAS